MANFRDKPCDFCGEDFTPKGARARYCERQECIAGRADRKKAMAAGADRIGDSAGAKERSRNGKTQTAAEAGRDQAAIDRVDELARRAAERAADQGACGEQQFIVRIKAVGDAKRAQDWPNLEGALIDMAACALSWAGRIDVAEGEDPLPPARVPVLREPDHANAKSNGHERGPSVAERYADILLDAAGSDLNGNTARSTIERLIGAGI